MITKTTLEDDLYNLLVEKKYEIILEFLKNPENEDIIKSKVWTLINKICLTVKTNKILEHESDLALCRRILLHIADYGKPREVIVALMEEADCFKEHSFFCLILDPLKETLKKVPTKRGKSLEWVLNTLNAHIETLPPPKEYDLEGEEKILLDATSEVVDANYVLSNYYQFIHFFVNEVSNEKLQSSKETIRDKVEYQQEILRKYILKLYNQPFLYHDLHIEDENKPKSTTRTLCENYMKDLSKITRDVFDLFRYDRSGVSKIVKTSDEEDSEENLSLLVFSNLSYLIFVEELSVNFQPFVYNHLHQFMKHLKYIISLISVTDNCVILKGLLLAQVLLGRLENLEISYDIIEVNLFTDFSRLLLNVAVHCQVKKHRQLAVENFMSYVNKCDWKARYHLIMQVVCSVGHSGCVGLAINLYKNYLHDNLNKYNETSYFLGKNLLLFLKKIFVLPEGGATDLLENNDRIMASLNFIRYLVLRDKKEKNLTGVWDLVKDVSESFLKPLSEAINMSRAHYKETAKQAEFERKRGKQKNIVTVNSTVMPAVAWKDVYEKALVTFDLLESLLSRVREIIE